VKQKRYKHADLYLARNYNLKNVSNFDDLRPIKKDFINQYQSLPGLNNK
jgi:hypothetical protein